jgi:hypothetical protein
VEAPIRNGARKIATLRPLTLMVREYLICVTP